MKRVNGCKDIVFARWTVKTDKFTLFVYCNFLVLLTVCSQNINKQNVNIADETLTDYNFLSRYHYSKSKNYLKRRYPIRHWIPNLLGHPVFKITMTIFLKCMRKPFGFSTFRTDSGGGRFFCSVVFLMFKSKIRKIDEIKTRPQLFIRV